MVTAESPSAWAHRVAFNLAKSHGRRAGAWGRAQARIGAPAIASVEPDRAAALAVHDARRGLPDVQRQALILRYFVDLSVRDTAVAMRCPENTVKAHTRRALEALRPGGLVDEDETMAEEAG